MPSTQPPNECSPSLQTRFTDVWAPRHTLKPSPIERASSNYVCRSKNIFSISGPKKIVFIRITDPLRWQVFRSRWCPGSSLWQLPPPPMKPVTLNAIYGCLRAPTRSETIAKRSAVLDLCLWVLKNIFDFQVKIHRVSLYWAPPVGATTRPGGDRERIMPSL